MQDQYLFVPITRGYFTYKDVFINKLYGLEDFDLVWQLINYASTSDTWSAIELET